MCILTHVLTHAHTCMHMCMLMHTCTAYMHTHMCSPPCAHTFMCADTHANAGKQKRSGPASWWPLSTPLNILLSNSDLPMLISIRANSVREGSQDLCVIEEGPCVPKSRSDCRVPLPPLLQRTRSELLAAFAFGEHARSGIWGGLGGKGSEPPSMALTIDEAVLPPACNETERCEVLGSDHQIGPKPVLSRSQVREGPTKLFVLSLCKIRANVCSLVSNTTMRGHCRPQESCL